MMIKTSCGQAVVLPEVGCILRVKWQHRVYDRSWKAALRRSSPEYRKQSVERVARYRATPEGYKKTYESMERYKKSEKGRATTFRNSHSMKGILKTLKANARIRNLECTVTVADIDALISPMKCAVTGMALEWGGHTKKYHPLSPSIDRLDNNEGYTAANVHCVALWVNLARNQTPLDEFMDILAKFAAGYGMTRR